MSVAGDAAGDFLAIWQVGLENRIEVAGRAAGGSWSAPETVSRPGQSAVEPSLTMSEDGRAIAAWRSYEDGHWVIQVALRAPGSTTWSAPETISDPAADIRRPVVTFGGDNRAPVAVAAWITSASPGQAQATAWTPQGGWGGIASLSEVGDDAVALALAVGANGEATAVWTGVSAGATTVKALTRLPGGTGWKDPVELASSTTSAFLEPAIAVDRSGQVTVAWTRYDSIDSVVVQARTRPAGTGTWEPPIDLSREDTLAGDNGTPPIGVAYEPRLAAGPPGEVTAVWSFVDFGSSSVHARSRPPGATGRDRAPRWGPIVDLSRLGPYETAGQPALARGARGKPVAAWVICGLFARCLVEASARTQPDAWDGPVTLSGSRTWATSPVLAADANGDVVAAWPGAEDELEPALVQAAGYDAAGPQLRELKMPATGTVGDAVAFSVTPVDVWSAVTSVEWDFGDGRSARGESVSHTYRRPGTYEARVTATDILSNSTHATASIRVRWPAVATQPLREAQERLWP